jgi:hypothetical protein
MCSNEVCRAPGDWTYGGDKDVTNQGWELSFDMLNRAVDVNAAAPKTQRDFQRLALAIDV